MYAVFFHGASDDLLLKVVQTEPEARQLQDELFEFYVDWLNRVEALIAEGDPKKVATSGDSTYVRHSHLPPQHPLVASARRAWGRDFGGSVFGISVVPLDAALQPSGYWYHPLD